MSRQIIGILCLVGLLLIAVDASARSWDEQKYGQQLRRVLLQDIKWEGGSGPNPPHLPDPPVGPPLPPIPPLPGLEGGPIHPLALQLPISWKEVGGAGGGIQLPGIPPLPGGGGGGGPSGNGTGGGLPPVPIGVGVPPCSSENLCTLTVKPYADHEYWMNYAPSDWQYRIVSAYMNGREMWSSENNLWLTWVEPEPVTFNFGEHGDDGGLDVFNQFVVSNGLIGPNDYALFQAENPMDWNPAGYGGLGYFPQPSCPHTLAKKGQPPEKTGGCPSYMIVAKDWDFFDTWNPDDTWLLGLAANHEMTHNAGEPNHPDDNGDCHANILQNGVPHWCKKYYRVQSSIGNVNAYVQDYLE